MTEPSTGGGAAAGDGLQIHKVLSRGVGAGAQVLLVLGSAPLVTPEGEEPDVWVAIGAKQADPIYAHGSGGSVESARRLADAELQALDLDHKEGARPFGLAEVAGRAFWLARFDFSDHAYARACWAWVCQEQARVPAPALDVVCWQARPGTLFNKEGKARDSFDPLPGSATAVPFAAADVVSQPDFELGVLLVHGIGSHGERETLVRWSEPIVKFWRARALAISQAAATLGTDAERTAIRRWVETHALRSREPINGIAEALGHFASSAAMTSDTDGRELPQPMVRPEATNAPLCCATAKAEQTLFSDRNPGSPSATLVRLSNLDRSATLRESHVLFAESAWAREAFPPTPDELYAWLTNSIPIAVWSRLERLATTRAAEIAEFAAAATDGFEKFRVLVSKALLLLQRLFLPTAYVILALASQVTIALVGVLGLLPIPWLGRGIRWVVSVLMGTLGQSYSLQTSPIRRSAIVSAVAIDIDWLSDRCQRIVVLSHSQGAEISRLAFLEARRSKMERWYTFGAGIAPLSMLSPRSLDRRGSKTVVAASNVLLAASLLAVILLTVDSIPGLGLGVRRALSDLMRDIHLLHVLVAWWALSGFLITVCDGGPVVLVNLRRSLLEKWTDLYASEDPVSGGSLRRRWTADLKKERIEGFAESRIFNTRFALLDHTTYWANIEQFVAPIALDLLRYAGLGSSKTIEQPALAAAARRRDRRTWWTLAGSAVASTAAAAAFLWIACGPPGRASAWLAEGRLLWTQKADAWDRLSLAWSNGFVGMLVRDLWLPILLLVLMVLGWSLSRWLGGRSARLLIRDLAATMQHAPAHGTGVPAPVHAQETP